MGATFPYRTYFYEADTKPDLVDTYGPLYSRTSKCLGNITPVGDITFSLSSIEGGETDFTADIINHNLHVIEKAAGPMTSDGTALVTAGLSGYIEFDAKSVTSSFYTINAVINTENFKFNGTQQAGYPMTGSACLCRQNPGDASAPYFITAAGNWIMQGNTITNIRLEFPCVNGSMLPLTQFICF